MPKPKSKQELIEQSQGYFEQLMQLIQSIPKNDRMQSFQSQSMNRNIRDVTVHLHEWHEMFLSWYEVGMKGKKPDMPASGFNWKQTPALNKKIWSDSQTKELDAALTDFNKSYQSIQKIIQKHTNEELFEKKKYPWTGSTSLAAYLISNTSSHYHWGIRKIKKGLLI